MKFVLDSHEPVVVIILTLVCSYWCLIQESFAAEREKRERESLAKSLAYLDVFAAHEKGIYRKYGLESEIIIMPPALSMVALQAGEIDYSFMAGTVVRVALKGLPVKLASLSVKSSFHTLVAKASIKSIAALQGKTIAISNVGSSDQVVAEYLLRKRGLDPRKDVVFMSMGGSDTRYQSLLTGYFLPRQRSLYPISLWRKHGASTPWVRRWMLWKWPSWVSELRPAKFSKSGNK